MPCADLDGCLRAASGAEFLLRLLCLFLACLAATGLARLASAAASGGERAGPPEWAKGLSIYEAEVGRFTEAGTFAEFERHVPALGDLGVGIIWLMPIFPKGGNPEGKPRSQSPYCVRDYCDVNPAYGTKEDFKRLVARVHEAGMYVILDWVGNHTSWGNPLVKEHPEYYTRDANGNIRQAGPWSDVAQLDYGNRDVWDYMCRARKHWLTECDVDGFREDVAGMIPIEHWKWLRPKLDAVKPVFMLAEADEPRHHGPFDATYDWTLQPYAYMIARGSWPASSIDKMLAWERKTYPPRALRMRHLTNHDMHGTGGAWANRKYLDRKEHKWLDEVPLAEKYGGGHRAFAVLCATLPDSVPMLWNGQEMGIVGKTPWPIPWADSPFRGFYAKLLDLHRRSPALADGDFARVATTRDEKVYAFLRREGANSVLVVLNLSDEAQAFSLDSAAAAGRYTELFTGERERVKRAQGFELEPWGCRVYVRGMPRAGAPRRR